MEVLGGRLQVLAVPVQLVAAGREILVGGVKGPRPGVQVPRGLVEPVAGPGLAVPVRVEDIAAAVQAVQVRVEDALAAVQAVTLRVENVAAGVKGSPAGVQILFVPFKGGGDLVSSDGVLV